jgi:hypothetical protein
VKEAQMKLLAEIYHQKKWSSFLVSRFVWLYIPYFLHPFINCRAPVLFTKLGYCE